eukprot:7098227-Alexandrium_andersonii.AAC.1
MSASLVGSEMCIRDSCFARETAKLAYRGAEGGHETNPAFLGPAEHLVARCLLYTSDAADDM